MSGPPTSPPDEHGSSTRPYLIRALHEWCSDNGFTPYLAVFVTPAVQVPPEYVKNQEIVLNVGFEATSGLELGNEHVTFKARFGGVPRDIVVPVDHVVAIYARENGQGMAFPMPHPGDGIAADGAPPRRRAGAGLRLASTTDAVDAAAAAAGEPSGSASVSDDGEHPARARPDAARDAGDPEGGTAADVPDHDGDGNGPPRRPALKRVK